jgi:inner membrane protein
MDNLTHTAVGLFLSRAGLNRWTPRATAILILAANAPDIDVASAAGGALNYLHYHRHLTHSFIAMPVMAALCVLAVWAVGRKPVHWLGAFAAAMFGVLSHLLLDFTNGYGIRLLLPFSPRYFRLEWTNVIDLWLWAVFLLAIAAPYLARLVGSEIASGGRRPAYPGRGWPIFALAFMLLYTGARAALHARAIGELQSRIYQDEEPLRVAASPSAANPLRWRSVVETRDFYALTEVNLGTPFDPTQARIVHKAEADPAMEAAKKIDTFRVFLDFAEFPQWTVAPAEEPENAKLATVTDMRFMGWEANALVDARERVLRSWFQMGDIRPR